MKAQPAEFRLAERGQTIRRTHLYYFNFEGMKYYYASFDEDISVTAGPGAKMSNPQAFVSAQIAHSSPGESTDSVPPAVDITLAAIDVELRKYLLTASPRLIDVEVYRVNSASLPGPIDYTKDLKMVFRGVVDSLSYGDLTVAASCVTLLAQEDRPIPRFNYQKTCNHMLYSAACGVNPALFNVSATIAAINKQSQYIDLAITSVNVGSPSRSITITSETFAGGFVTDALGNKMGVLVCDVLGGGSGTRLWLNWMPRTLNSGDSVTSFLGCLRIKKTCDGTFFNLPNFGGHPYIPINNPAIDGISA